jgi:hypothetical protein
MVAAEGELPSNTAAPSADAIPLRLRRNGGTARQVLVLTLVGTFVLAVFASRDLSGWLDRMGGGRVLEPIQRAAAQWEGAMERLGLVRPHEALRGTIRQLLDWEWGSPP